MSIATTTPAVPALGTAQPRTGRRSRRWKATPLLIITLLVAVAGATVLVYSPAAQWFSRLNQASVVRDYADEVDHAAPVAKVQLREAQRYNDPLSAGAI